MQGLNDRVVKYEKLSVREMKRWKLTRVAEKLESR